MARKHFEVETKDTGKHIFKNNYNELTITKVKRVQLDGNLILENGIPITTNKKNGVDLLPAVVIGIIIYIIIMVLMIGFLDKETNGEAQNYLSFTIAVWGLLTTIASPHSPFIMKGILQILSWIMNRFLWFLSLITKEKKKKIDAKANEITKLLLTLLILIGIFWLAVLITVAVIKNGIHIAFANTISAIAVAYPLFILLYQAIKTK